MKMNIPTNMQHTNNKTKSIMADVLLYESTSLQITADHTLARHSLAPT